jgi:hypothetical protein
MMTVRIEHAQSDLRAVSKAMRQNGNAKVIRAQLTKGLRAGAKPALTATKAAALSLPSHGSKHTGLRAKMARTAGTQVRTGGNTPGVTVRVSRARMGSQASLATVTNEGQWRHPVYQRPGKPPVWAVQTSRKGWFDNANRFQAPVVRRELVKVIDDVKKSLTVKTY